MGRGWDWIQTHGFCPKIRLLKIFKIRLWSCLICLDWFPHYKYLLRIKKKEASLELKKLLDILKSSTIYFKVLFAIIANNKTICYHILGKNTSIFYSHIRIIQVGFVLSLLCYSCCDFHQNISLWGFFSVIKEDCFHSNEMKHFSMHLVLIESQWIYSYM